MPKAIGCGLGAKASSTGPHGVHLGPEDTIWLTDDGDHTVRNCTLDGKVLMTLGIPGEPKALHERRAVPPLHAHSLVAAR